MSFGAEGAFWRDGFDFISHEISFCSLSGAWVGALVERRLLDALARRPMASDENASPVYRMARESGDVVVAVDGPDHLLDGVERPVKHQA